MREGKEGIGPKRNSRPKLHLQLLLYQRTPGLTVREREKLQRRRKLQLPIRGPETLSLLLGLPPLLLRRRRWKRHPAMRNIQNPNCPLGKSPTSLHVPTGERKERGGERKERGNESGRRKWIRTESENGRQTQISKVVVEGSIIPEDEATVGLTVVEAGGVGVEAGQNTPIESPDHAQIYHLLQVLLPFATGRKVKREVRARTLRLYQNVDGAVVQTQTLKVKAGGSLPVILDHLTVSLAPNLAVH